MDEMTLIELKALAYDHLAELERLQGSLTAINTEIHKRSTQPPAAKIIKMEPE